MGSSEFDLLCLLARPRPEPERALDILQGGIDAATLLRLATEHAVRPPLVRWLSQISWQGMPSDVRRELERFQHLHLVRMLALVEELARIAARFERDGLAFAAFKGATLAVSLYGDLTAREYNDIDLLVPARSVSQAEVLLGELGYRGVHGDAAYRRAFFGYQRQSAFFRADLSTTIDLHWDLSGSHLPFPLAPADLLRNAVPVSAGRARVPAPAHADLALLLAGHGTKEAWRCLGWVADFAHLVARDPDLDWLVIHHRAAARGSGNAVLLGCLLAEGLMAVAVPPALAPAIAANRPVRARAEALMAGLRAGEPMPERIDDLADFDLCDRRRDRLLAILRIAFTRTDGDYRALPLPRLLWGLYYFLRPFRLAAKALGRLVRIGA